MAESGSSAGTCGSACKRGVSFGWNAFVSTAFEYNTPRIVHIKNKKVGILNRLVQLGILGYMIGYSIIYQKGYQTTGPVSSVVTTKVKGAYVYTGGENYTQNCEDPVGITTAPWDVGDLIIPPEEPNSFFVMTNTWITCNQTWGNCTESPSVFGSKCETDDDCLHMRNKSLVLVGGNGPLTGRCINASDGSGQRCEITAWCPTEHENTNITHKEPKIDARNFTVLVKNSIEFPTLNRGERKRNLPPIANESFFHTCNHSQSLYCPIFPLHEIVDMIPPDEGNKTDFQELAKLGGVVGLDIVWDCDLDWGLESCDPKYSAKRLDDPHVNISKGFNFRFTKYYNIEGIERRKMYKAYGILFKMEVSGTGGKFDAVTLVVKLGSMLALLSIATIVSDVIVLYVLGKRDYYRTKKYLNVNDPITDDYQIIDDESDDIMRENPNILPSVNNR